MKIRIIDGAVAITADIPVFIGSTSKKGQFPSRGERMFDFWFQPKKYTAGYLVFDHEDEKRRTPTSSIFIHYDWNARGKLVVEEGLKLDRSIHGACCTIVRKAGLVYSPPNNFSDEGMYYTGEISSSVPQGPKKVGILNMLRFIEGRITLDQLDKLVIE